MTLDIIAYNIQIECVLLQNQLNDKASLIWYWSRSVSDTQKIYNIAQ